MDIRISSGLIAELNETQKRVGKRKGLCQQLDVTPPAVTIPTSPERFSTSVAIATGGGAAATGLKERDAQAVKRDS